MPTSVVLVLAELERITCSEEEHAEELFYLLSSQLCDNFEYRNSNRRAREVAADFMATNYGCDLPLRAHVVTREGEAQDLALYDDSQRAEIALLDRALPPTHDAYSCWTTRDWD